MERAYVALSIKALDDDARQIEGWASRVEEDRMGDIVMPKGVTYELPLPFLLDHDHKMAVGEVDRVEVTDKGIRFWAHIKKITEAGEVKDLTDKAWALVKNGLRRAVSIGFKPKEFEPLPTGGLKFTAWEWLELSAVSVPAAAGAKITGTKSYSVGDTFAAIDPEIPADPEPAASGKSVRVVKLDDPARDRAEPFVIRKIKR
ncbi:HK97 family phage prohead protease [Pelagibacterium sp.]|uniref:HK97 family phage prohead protease n=1 Tax=Pelagibacterium sp. TaxID=1967288 RepID=UPI003A8E115D